MLHLSAGRYGQALKYLFTCVKKRNFHKEIFFESSALINLTCKNISVCATNFYLGDIFEKFCKKIPNYRINTGINILHLNPDPENCLV